MTGKHVMAALGFVIRRAPLGYSAFCGKMELSQQDKQRAVLLLTATGIRESVRYPGLHKLPLAEREAIIAVIARYAFLDYARSVETELTCHKCEGTGFSKSKCCTKCQGKGFTRAACKDCKGRGESVNSMKTRLQGVPVYQHCQRCGGRGFERIASTVVFRAVCQVTQAISLDVWNKSVKQLLEFLTSELHREEAWAEKQLLHITK
nr:antitermination protein [Pantoea septica]